MDVVYLLRRWPKDCIELKYSLRSLSNIQHDRVFIVWYRPRRIRKINHIQADDKWYRFDNVINKYRLICNDERISDDFILMHDDNYILNKLDTIPYYKRWTLKEHKEAIYDKFWENMYYKSINWVYEMFKKWYSFDVHTPIIYNKNKFKKIIDMYWWLVASKRSIYCNYYHIKWVKYEHKDCKLYKGKLDIDDKADFLSSDDNIVNEEKFINFIKQKFPNKSKYESFNLLPKQTMIFKYKPLEAFSLGSLVKFNSIWEFTTDDAVLIERLSKIEWVTIVDGTVSEKIPEVISPVETPTVNEATVNETVEQTEAVIETAPVEDIKVLRSQYKEKFGKNAFGWWSIEQLKEKLA